jgi:hypothetical protein
MGDGNQMRLVTDPFPANVNLINCEKKRVLVRTSQADTTHGKNPRWKMVKPKRPEPGVWTVNQ